MTKVIIKNLGRHGALGLADTEKKVIEIDPRQKPKQYLDSRSLAYFIPRYERNESKEGSQRDTGYSLGSQL